MIERIALGFAVGILVGAFLAWEARSTEADLQLLELRTTFDKALATAREESNAVEQDLQAKINGVGQSAHDEAQQIDANNADAVVSTDGLLDAAARSISASACDPGVARRGAAATSAAYLYSQLLGESQRLARGLAEEADRSRLAGASCEVAYDTVREGLKRMGRL